MYKEVVCEELSVKEEEIQCDSVGASFLGGFFLQWVPAVTILWSTLVGFVASFQPCVVLHFLKYLMVPGRMVDVRELTMVTIVN